MLGQQVGSYIEVHSSGLIDPLFCQRSHPVGKAQLGQQIRGAGLVYLLEVVEDHLGDGDVQQHVDAGQGEVVEEAEEEDGQGGREEDRKCVLNYHIDLLQSLADGLHSGILGLTVLNFLIKWLWLWLRGGQVAHHHNVVDHQLHAEDADRR